MLMMLLLWWVQLQVVVVEVEVLIVLQIGAAGVADDEKYPRFSAAGVVIVVISTSCHRCGNR